MRGGSLWLGACTKDCVPTGAETRRSRQGPACTGSSGGDGPQQAKGPCGCGCLAAVPSQRNAARSPQLRCITTELQSTESNSLPCKSKLGRRVDELTLHDQGSAPRRRSPVCACTQLAQRDCKRLIELVMGPSVAGLSLGFHRPSANTRLVLTPLVGDACATQSKKTMPVALLGCSLSWGPNWNVCSTPFQW